MNNKYSKRNIKKIMASPSPRILLNVCTHGTERVGLKVAKHFEEFKPLCGTFVINVANEKALKMRKRFIADDLNRVFPGKKNGSHEEKLAYAMKPFIDAFDVVMDIHSTETGLASSLIVTTMTPETKRVLKAISPKRVICMKATKSNALISSAKVGVGFEYGKDKSKRTYTDTVRGVTGLLKHYKMMKPASANKVKNEIEYYVASGTVEKPEGFNVDPNIRNFKLLEKGSLLGYNPKSGKKIYTKKSFYPVLFGKNNYKTIFGFCSQKRKL